MLRINVITNRDKPKAKATKVLGFSNSTSPIRAVTICVVIVVAGSSGLNVKLARKLAAITTIIVSPIALEMANKKDPIIPGSAAGNITFFIVSDFVAPKA